MANIIDKYLNKKKKEIYEYSKVINNMLEYNPSQIWTNDSEFNELVKNILNVYVDKYYFHPMTEFSEYSEYLGALIKCDDRFKTVLVCTIENISETSKVGNYKVSSYILALIVYTSIALNRFTYPFNSYKISITTIFSIIDTMFKNIDFLSLKDDSKNRNKLVDLIKKNNSVENKLFVALRELNTDVSKNVYVPYDIDGKYLKVDYKYSIPEFKNYRSRDVKKYFKRIKDDLNVLSYELATLTVLKSELLSKNITLLFPADLKFYSKEMEINKLAKVLSNESLKDKIKLLINYNDYKENGSIVRMLINAGFSVALDFDEVTDVSYRTFNEIKLVFVPAGFEKANIGNMDSWKSSEVVFIQKTEIYNELSELKVLGMEEK